MTKTLAQPIYHYEDGKVYCPECDVEMSEDHLRIKQRPLFKPNKDKYRRRRTWKCPKCKSIWALKQRLVKTKIAPSSKRDIYR